MAPQVEPALTGRRNEASDQSLTVPAGRNRPKLRRIVTMLAIGQGSRTVEECQPGAEYGERFDETRDALSRRIEDSELVSRIIKPPCLGSGNMPGREDERIREPADAVQSGGGRLGRCDRH